MRGNRAQCPTAYLMRLWSREPIGPLVSCARGLVLSEKTYEAFSNQFTPSRGSRKGAGLSLLQ